MSNYFHTFEVDSFRYYIVKTSVPRLFTLNKLDKNSNKEKVCKLVGVESTAFGKTNLRFESFQPISYFWEIADRVAIRDAIAYLEKEYEAQ